MSRRAEEEPLDRFAEEYNKIQARLFRLMRGAMAPEKDMGRFNNLSWTVYEGLLELADIVRPYQFEDESRRGSRIAE